MQEFPGVTVAPGTSVWNGRLERAPDHAVSPIQPTSRQSSLDASPHGRRREKRLSSALGSARTSLPYLHETAKAAKLSNSEG